MRSDILRRSEALQPLSGRTRACAAELTASVDAMPRPRILKGEKQLRFLALLLGRGAQAQWRSSPVGVVAC